MVYGGAMPDNTTNQQPAQPDDEAGYSVGSPDQDEPNPQPAA
jgi:hypothetical protein